MFNQYNWYLASLQKEWKKSPDGAAVQKYQKQIIKQWYLHYLHHPGVPGVSKNQTEVPFCELEHWDLAQVVKNLKNFQKTIFVQLWPFFTVSLILAES